jgi:hypothetical protein
MLKILIAITTSFLVNSAALAQALPAYSGIQSSLSGVVGNVAAKRGFAANDPRIYSTLNGIGSAATSIAQVAGPALLASSGLPVWATLLGSAALNYAVPLGVDALVKWQFGGSTNTPITITAPSTVAQGAQQTIPIYPSGSYLTWDVITSNSLNKAWTAVISGPPAYSKTFYTTTTSTNPDSNYYAGFVNFQSGNQTLYAWYPKMETALSTPCPTGYSQSGANCILGAINTTATIANQTLSQATNALTDTQKSIDVNTQTMASLINYLWQQAASKPGYAGLPYLATEPILSSDVDSFKAANPAIYPKVSALVTPIPTGSNGLYPSSSTTPTSGAQIVPATSTNSTTAINPSTSSQINLGADPATPSPVLETTPTAEMILAPILSMMPTLKSFAVPTHSGICPTPNILIFNRNFSMHSHCDLLEQLRTTIASIMVLAYVLSSMIIILKA